LFVERVRERVTKLTVGDPVLNPNMGPVVNHAAMESILNYIEVGKAEGRLIAGGAAVESDDGGYLIQPTVFADIAPAARLSQEEIFGPVLAVIKANGFEDALAIANNTEYGLTGAIYAHDRGELDRAKRDFHVGNLYLNRKCTGAMVGAHPFGGFNMSGTDSKAGGPDYLYLFTQAKSVAEKLSG
jgi:1-pyrroline-5-carboxylate dehydrogenase